MLEKTILFLKKRENIIYLFFGVLTTAVNWAVYLPLYYYLKMSATFSHAIAWVVSVIFAYLTNKTFVFHSYNWDIKNIIPEFFKFVGGRILTGCIEAGILALMVDLLGFDGFIWKLISSIITVVLNYIFSKLFIFHKDN